MVTVQLHNCDFTVFHLSEKLRQKGWIVPAYTLPANAEDIAVLRMVVKESFSKDMVEMLYSDMMEAVEKLEQTEEERVKTFDENKNPSLLY
jgi:glutamate decarboxylase